MPTFNGNEGTMITLADGATLTAAFRKKCPAQPLAYFFGINNLNDILSQTGCMGIRVYFGADSSGHFTMVLVGADANQNDQTAGFILDEGVLCPTACGTANSLNSNS